MADFGKLDFSTSFNPTSAFPLDARCYFTDLESARAAAATAEEVGSTNTVYYYGMRVLVSDGESSTWYTITPDKKLVRDGKQLSKVDNWLISKEHKRSYYRTTFYYTDGSKDEYDHYIESSCRDLFIFEPDEGVYTSGKLWYTVDTIKQPSGGRVSERDTLITPAGEIYVVSEVDKDYVEVIEDGTPKWVFKILFRVEYITSLKSADGKSAYQYAVEGGYTGSEEEFGSKLAGLINSGSSGGSTIIPGGGTSDDVAAGQAQKVVLYTEQTLTDEQKAQARTNIGALSEADISESFLQRLIAQQFDKFVVIGRDEPDHGSCIWFDTNIEVPIYLILDDYTDDIVVSTEINNTKYSVLNTDNPTFADDGTVIIKVSE